jgi:hypothetical protein
MELQDNELAAGASSCIGNDSDAPGTPRRMSNLYSMRLCGAGSGLQVIAAITASRAAEDCARVRGGRVRRAGGYNDDRNNFEF